MSKIAEKIDINNVAAKAINPRSRALIWKSSAGILKGKIKNVGKQLRDIRKEWDRF